MRQLAFTIFGGTGDLTLRKLLPALYNLQAQSKLEEDFSTVIIGCRNHDYASYHEETTGWIRQYTRLLCRMNEFERLTRRIHYVQMGSTGLEDYERLNAFYKEQYLRSHVFYFAIVPCLFAVMTGGLERVGKVCTGRAIIEEPSGEDLESARALNEDLKCFFTRRRMFHIDHYLGEEMMRNMQVIRLMNPTFQDVWNVRYIEHAQISATETVGIENRGDYYDQGGALRDMVQNHLFQILSIAAME